MLPAIWMAAALSGGAALAYEVCWSRALVVPLGNSTDAAALVLAGFMLGIAAGAWLGGIASEKARNPLRLYAVVEIALGLFALVAPWLLSRLSLVGFVPLRQLAALVLIALPCLAMGASLPLLVRALTASGDSLGRRIGIVYGINTAGAAAGALWTGFFGLARLGVSRCSSWAAVASVAAALFAVVASTRTRHATTDGDGDEPAVAVDEEARRAALIAAAVSGFVMLGCEMLWARVLTFVFGHDAYAFATLLVMVLLGLSLGGMLHRTLARFDQRNVLFVVLALFAVSLLAAYWLAGALVVKSGRDPFGIAGASDLAVSVWIELYRAIAYTPILVLAPATLSGLSFTAACSLYAGGAPDSGRRVGVVFLANGLGSTLGALIAAFFLVRGLGIQGSFIALALISAGGAFVVLRARRLVTSFAPLVATGALALVMPRSLPRKMLLQSVGDRHQQLLHYDEGRTSTVSVIVNDLNGEKQLLMNGVNEVTTRLVHDQSFKILGHLGPLLHPQPKKVVMICLGAGLSAGATMSHPIDRLDIVDLSSSVAGGARWFARENNGVLDDPRMQLHIEDGRHYLLDHAGGFDVAVIDSTHPKAVDSWILYTKEFYELVRARLADGGVVVQWLPLHGLSEREFQIIVRTFLAAFPEMSLWANVGFETYGPVGYAKLVAIKGHPLAIDHAALARKLADPRIHDDLAPFGLATPEEILDLFLAGPPAIDAWTTGLPVQTDEHPIVPYTTPYSSGRRMIPALLLAVREPVRPFVTNLPEIQAIDDAYEAQGLVLAGLLDRAQALHPTSPTVQLFVAQSQTTLGYYTALADRYPDDVEKLLEAGNQLGTSGHPGEAAAIYARGLALRPSDFRLRLNQALLLAQIGSIDASLAILSRLREEQPTSPTVLFDLGATLLAKGDAEGARAQLELALGWDPQHTKARLALAVAQSKLGDLDRAEATLAIVLRENPLIAEAHDLAGTIALQKGDLERALDHLHRAVRLHPYRAASHVHLAEARRAKGELALADASYAMALRLDPRDTSTITALAAVRALEGRADEAADLLLQALDVDPHLALAALDLARIRRAQGRAAEAKNAFCLALELGVEAARDGCEK